MDTVFETLRNEHGPLLQKVATVLTQAADELDKADSVLKTASSEKVPLDEERVRDMCEGLVAHNLAKTADIERAVDAITQNPGESLLAVTENILNELSKTAATDVPGQPARFVRSAKAVPKTASTSSGSFEELEASLAAVR